MKRLFILFLVLLVLSSGAMAKDAVWLPDPGPALGVEAAYNQTNTEPNGVTYDYYTYDFENDADGVSHFIVTYTEALRNIGFTSKKLKLNNNAVYYQAFTKSEFTAELAVFATDAKAIAQGDAGSWRIVLAVPQGMTFTAGSGAPGLSGGNTICIACRGTGKCEGCGGTGRANYGSGTETCIICNGYCICNVCDGEGDY